MAELVTVPSFVFHQGDPGDDQFENPIHVQFYHHSFCIQQGEENIMLTYDHFASFVKEIKKHMPEALDQLKRK